MGPLLCLFQVKDGPAGDDLPLEADVLLEHLLEGEDLGGPVHQGQHDDAHRLLHLAVGVELV